MFLNENKEQIKAANNARRMADLVSGSHNPEDKETRKQLRDAAKNTHIDQRTVKDYNNNNASDRFANKYIKKSINDIESDRRMKKRNEKLSESTHLTNNTGHNYLNEAIYADYLADKIYNEQRLAREINKTLIMKESTTNVAQKVNKITALYEAKLSDTIKSKWNKFITFIKTLMGKFMESMTKILLDEKGYLEKYKDIILKKRPKDDIEFSYTGDYREAANRLMNTELPLFNYEQYKAELKAEGNIVLAQKLLKNFQLDSGSELSDQMKEYFIAADKGESKGKLSGVNMRELYDFCYNFKKIKDITDKDINHLESSTMAIQNAINAEIRKQPAETNTVEKTKEAPAETPKPENNENSKKNSGSKSYVDKKNESTIIREADEKQAPINTNLSIKTTTYTDNDKKVDNVNAAKTANANAASGEKETDIDAMISKWITVCRTIITAKWTASEQIAKDYMALIRAHVRSYVGTKEDKADNQAAKQGTNYQKDREKQEQEKSEEQK